MRISVLVFMFAMALPHLSAHAEQLKKEIQTPAHLQKLIVDPTSQLGQAWRNLLFVKDEKPLMLEWNNGDHTFYQTQPNTPNWVLAELQAVLNDLSESGFNSEKVCEYPARFNWVYRQLHGASMPFPLHCKELANWIENGKVQSVDLLLVSGYLSNPASTFGHTLLNVRAGLGANHRSLEDSMNYGALVPPGEGVLPYIFKGLFGGYSAGFSDGAYSVHMNTYQEKELRAIWRYEFDMSESQKMDFVYRMAEVVTFKFPYYFLSENCGWAMGRMISEVSGASLNISDDPTWFAPIELIHLLKGVKNPQTNAPLVKTVQYTAAGQSVLQAKYAALSPASKHLYQRLLKSPFNASQDVVNGETPPATDTEYALDAALSFWQTVNLDSETNRYINEKDAVLKARLSLPAKAPYIPEINPYPNSIPHESQKSGQMQTGVLLSNRRNSELKLKYASFEQGDRTLHPLGVGRALSVFVFEAASTKSGFRLDEAKVLAVSSVGVPDDTGMSDYGGLLSWRVDVALGRRVGEPDYLHDLDQGGFHGLRPKFTGAGGFTKTNAQRTVMAGAYIEPEVGTGEHPVTFGWLGKVQYRPNHRFSTTLDLRLRAAYSPVSANSMFVGYGRQSTMFVESNSVIKVSKNGAMNVELYHSDLDHGAGIYFSHTF